MGQGRVVPAHEWALLSTPDIYFSQAYHAVSAFMEQNVQEAVLLEWSDDFGHIRLPLIVRRIADEDFYDATSAYGYGGPWVEGNPSLLSFRQFIDSWAKENRIVSTFLRFHPLIDNAKDFMSFFPVKHAGKTARWEFENKDDLIGGMAKNHRKSWRRAVRAGVEARVMPRPQDASSFRDIYDLSMGRLAANSFYWFSDEYWCSLTSDLGKNSLQVDALYEDRVVASVWCLFSQNFLHFHLSGTTREGRDLGGAFICRVAAAEWARERGIKEAHFGGGVNGDDSSLLDWKSRFDSTTPLSDFYVGSLVHLKEKYQQFSMGLEGSTYFPPWRDPRVRKLIWS